MTYEYTPSEQEQELYNLLYTYINQPNKIAFPEMDRYDLALRLLGLQSSSTAAIMQTIKGIIKRLEKTKEAEDKSVAQIMRHTDVNLRKTIMSIKTDFLVIQIDCWNQKTPPKLAVLKKDLYKGKHGYIIEKQ